RMKSDEYSKEIIKKMTLSIRTIMNVNKDDALNNIKRLSKSENPRLRYDCVKIIENILTHETLKILVDMLDDSDCEVKRAAIMLLSNINKLHLPEIPLNMLSEVQKRLTEEKLKNGWII
ncbi:MAG: HEAT repeat domain-containing protein, partial [Elusimicrobiota bacterium]|nr:HEAT repeat domain-containing protein [Elusimicrobiota bacterium]